MPIKSYLAHPYDGKKQELINAISTLTQCEIFPAANKELLVLVTDTEDENQETILKEKLEAIASLKLLAMVSGFNTPKKS